MSQSGFITPRYDQGGFASLPARLAAWLTSGSFDAVIFFLVDGFGWRFFEQVQDAPFLRQAASAGRVEKLTSQFPSTTAAHLTTIHTGLPVGEHAVLEWYYYEPLLDALIAPLLFSFAGDLARDTLKGAGVRPSRLLPANPFYPPLNRQGIRTTIFQHREYTPSTFSNVVFHGARMLGYKTLPEACINLEAELQSAVSPVYLFLYYDRIDSICHEYGPNSPQTITEIQSFLHTMEQVFLPILIRNHRKVLFLLTADHGQVEVDPEKTIYLNRHPAFAGVEKFLRTDRHGQLLAPAGSARDFFLYVHPAAVEETRAFLSTRLEGRAEVRLVTDLASSGFFGPRLGPRFYPHAGDLVILPYPGESVWWYEKDRFEQRFRGHHGGLTPQELEIPLIAWEM